MHNDKTKLDSKNKPKPNSKFNDYYDPFKTSHKKGKIHQKRNGKRSYLDR